MLDSITNRSWALPFSRNLPTSTNRIVRWPGSSEGFAAVSWTTAKPFSPRILISSWSCRVWIIPWNSSLFLERMWRNTNTWKQSNRKRRRKGPRRRKKRVQMCGKTHLQFDVCFPFVIPSSFNFFLVHLFLHQLRGSYEHFSIFARDITSHLLCGGKPMMENLRRKMRKMCGMCE